MRIGRREIHRALVNSDSAVTDMEGVILGRFVVPQLFSVVRVHGPEVVWCADVNNAADEYWRCLDLRVLAGFKRPDFRQTADVRRCDLRQRTVPAAGVITV